RGRCDHRHARRHLSDHSARERMEVEKVNTAIGTADASGAVGASVSPARATLVGQEIVAGCGDREILRGVDLTVPEGECTVNVGPNACGKSTLLKTLARGLKSAGVIELEGRPLSSYRPKELARVLGMLPQHPTAPEGITVAELVARGRYPHQALLRQWSADD